MSFAPLQASAHPLGNFSINHLVLVQSKQNVLHVRVVLDIAEIPSFQIMHPGGNAWSSPDRERWIESENQRILTDLSIEIDAKRIPLTLQRETTSTRPGAGGLPTLYWVGDYAEQLSEEPHRVTVGDTIYADRATGWRDIAVGTHRDITNQLRSYPGALLSSPRHVNNATFTITRDGDVVNASVVSDEQAASGPALLRTNALTDMFSQHNRAPLFVLLTLAVAFLLGALHAIEPGHGKALLAFTLVGSRATVGQAAILALSLTFAHTIGVILLGIALFFVSGFVAESIYPWITLVSGGAVAVIGARLLAAAARRRFAAGLHDHGDGTAHHHGDGDTAHSHAIAGTGPIRFRSAIAAAMSGGVAPCPAAIVVMLAALRMHQVGYGLIVIIVFSLGLASVLTALGLAVVLGTAMLKERRGLSWVVAQGPLLSASLISVIGAIMVGQGFVAQGVHASVWSIAGLVVLAIAAYGLSAQAHSHRHEEASA